MENGLERGILWKVGDLSSFTQFTSLPWGIFKAVPTTEFSKRIKCWWWGWWRRRRGIEEDMQTGIVENKRLQHLPFLFFIQIYRYFWASCQFGKHLSKALARHLASTPAKNKLFRFPVAWRDCTLRRFRSGFCWPKCIAVSSHHHVTK